MGSFQPPAIDGTMKFKLPVETHTRTNESLIPKTLNLLINTFVCFVYPHLETCHATMIPFDRVDNNKTNIMRVREHESKRAKE